jgi:predicted phosphodiesterase
VRLLAISDLHLGHPVNRDALADLPAFPDDWLIVAGDVAESFAMIGHGLAELARRFARVIWVPGNHELWSQPERDGGLAGTARYEALVMLARRLGVLTPEDPWPVWRGSAGPPLVIVPMFTLYDYTFAPPGMDPEQVLAWAAETDIFPVDERLLRPDPHPSRVSWCHERVALTRARLDALPAGSATILVDHYPLLADLARLPAVPRFAPWCGTRLTESWPRRYGAKVCLYGHLHIRSDQVRDGITYREISLGYPRQWKQEKGIAGYIRQIA